MYSLMLSCFLFALAASAVIDNDGSIKMKWERKKPKNNDLSLKYGKQLGVSEVVCDRINVFALTIDKLLSKSLGGDTNIVFSPLDIIKTLSLVMLGTEGKTEKELSVALGVIFNSSINKLTSEYHRSMRALLKKVVIEDPDNKFDTLLSSASALFISNEFKANPQFEKNVRHYYFSEVNILDFLRQPTESANYINKWIDEKTKHRISNVINHSMEPSTKIVIAGATYFNGAWETPFVEKMTRWQPFKLRGDNEDSEETVLVELMWNHGNVSYYFDSELGYSSIGIPYKNQNVLMFYVLPDKYVDLRELLNNFTKNDIQNIIKKSTIVEKTYMVPKMKLESQFDLKHTLEELNVKSLFNPATANFEKISRGIYASSIIHKAEMEVNERGTIATAATVMAVNRIANYFRVDRPFACFIYNAKTGTMVFWATVQKPIPNRPNEV